MSSNNNTTTMRVTRAARQATGIEITTSIEQVAPARTTKKAPAKKPATKKAAAAVEPQIKHSTAIDDALKKELEAQRKQPFLWGTQLEAPSKKEMDDDFAQMGFTADKIGRMNEKRSLLKVDGFAQMPFPGNGKSVQGTGPRPEKKVKKPAARGKGRYQDLIITEGQDWVLFDHLQGYPEKHGEPPAAITKWAVFKPGNAKVILQHKKTKILLSQTTPENLKGKEVDYTTSGPRVHDFEAIKKAAAPVAAPVAAPAPAAEPAEAPLLDRGGRRIVRFAEPATAPQQGDETAPPAPTAPAPPATGGKKRRAEEAFAEGPALPPGEAKKPKTAAPAAPAAVHSEEAASAQPAAPQPAAPASKKRKAADIADDDDDTTTTVAAELPPPPSKKRRSRPLPPPRVLPPRTLRGKHTTRVVEVPAVVEGPKRKRGPGRPKKTPERVENSSSE